MNDKPGADLQFERAEYASPPPAALRCAACGQELFGNYYQVNGKPTCERCKTDLELGSSEGSPAGRFLRAAFYGAAAGAVGAGLWYAVEAIAHLRVGLISIVVGFMVGGAVKAGSKGRGGFAYQALAVFLTYTSIVSTYVPVILKATQQGLEKTDKGEVTEAGVAQAGETPQAQQPKPSFGKALLALVLVFAVAFAAPFLEGAQNIIGLLIIAFGLWEAWKINRRQSLEITGPYRVGPAPAAPTAGG